MSPGRSVLFWGLNKEFPAVTVIGLQPSSKGRELLQVICEEQESIRRAAAAGCKKLQAAGIKNIYVECLGNAEAAAEGSKLGTWIFQEYKSNKNPLPEVSLYTFSSEECDMWYRGYTKASAQNLARKLVDTPSNLLTPTIYAETMTRLLEPLDISVVVRDQEWAEKERMNAFLAVGKGSCEPPKFVEISYKNSDSDPFVLVGKGVTFDSGGINIKADMSDLSLMRNDMSGTACIVSALYALATLKVPVHVKALLPLVENMPSGSATKPGDIITARNGKSIRISNTDAEGRIILADALSYSADFKPKWVLDVATLTWSGLAKSIICVFSNSDKLYRSFEEAAMRNGDKIAKFPLFKYYSKQVTSYRASDTNCIGLNNRVDTCNAAAFLKEFVPAKTEWIHVDTGAAESDSEDYASYLASGGMTGRSTRTLIDFIVEEAKK